MSVGLEVQHKSTVINAWDCRDQNFSIQFVFPRSAYKT